MNAYSGPRVATVSSVPSHLVHGYATETFTSEEQDILRRYFTNLDRPVFALVNLPEVVKGALFARYSRTHKSLRRLFLDEFVLDLDVAGDSTIDATVGLERADELYQKVFFEFGDDSVAQLGGVHLACEQASNMLTKVLEWGRIMSYLEQSTRYLAYDARIDGRFRYYRDPDLLASSMGTRYVGDMDRMFESYASALPTLQEYFKATRPKTDDESDFVHRQTLRAMSFDAVRGMLPAASISNVGIYGTGQAYEALLLRMRSHPLPEARAYADMMLEELRKVIPSFLRRVDLADRGGLWSEYLAENRSAMESIAGELVDPGGHDMVEGSPGVDLVDWDPEGETKAIAAMLYPYTHLPDREVLAQVERMCVEDRMRVVKAYCGERRNRRHKPGRALERTFYRFDILSDYGAFRDLQRHRMLTVEWQDLSPVHGFVRPSAVDAAGADELFDRVMDRSAALYEDLAVDHGRQAPYAVSMAFRVRYVMQLNLRAAMHMLELRSAPQGHPAYRKIAQEMYRQIGDVAGHKALASLFIYMDMSDGERGRAEAETRLETRKA
ncbi:MAG: thymidylate synthase [Actinomycetia bacterium]|nr:thymidylate synthase [Actinomycetes bacterium]MCP4959312.1 thymidylate synthase [Actinomycetes bacterium]